MKRFNKNMPLWALSLFILLCFSCQKYLDIKPNKKMVIPGTLQDLQGLLDNAGQINVGYGIGEAASDNYYVYPAVFSALSQTNQNIYTWNNDRLFDMASSQNAWSKLYDNVYLANLVLFYLDQLKTTANDDQVKSDIKGQALFIRARAFLNITSIWCLAYDKSSTTSDQGIPLRLTPDFNEKTTRATLQESYSQILHDLQDALTDLTDTPISKSRPSKTSAATLLARAYLYMQEFDSCYKYASIAMGSNGKLLDYNTIQPAGRYSFSNIYFETNPEITYYSAASARPALLSFSNAKADTVLLNLYESGDLRKNLYFIENTDHSFSYRGSYLGSLLFDGITSTEALLMKAECAARLKKTDEALDLVNLLLKNRWNKGSEIKPAISPDQVINAVLLERRKEFVFRDLRWMDIKRLNKLNMGYTMKRILNDKVYTLPPNDLRYAMAIPEDIISLTGIAPNRR